MVNPMYGSRCEYCYGTIQAKTLEREAFKHKDGFVILENVTVGVCDNCGSRYYHADVLHAVHDVATGVRASKGNLNVPVAEFTPFG
jgi:YgiT-type zinc finger domain-containing protein